MKGKIVCFDTQVIIWGIKGEANEDQKEMIDRAKHLISLCEKKGTNVIIPSIVVAELLSGTQPDLHSNLLGVLSNKFMIIPFDSIAALHYAKIWKENKENGINAGSRGITRAEMKADCLIVATAISRGAHCIYSFDRHLDVFSNGRIEIRDLPIRPVEQLDLL